VVGIKGWSMSTPADYCEFKSNPANDHISDGVWCSQNKVSMADLQTWKAEHPAEVERILTTRRARYADEMIKIDTALLTKAKQGDPKSIQLAWARFENWSPKIEEEAAKKTGGKNKTIAELINEDA
jgi:hypothetical protein